jgi:hypothetical protein
MIRKQTWIVLAAFAVLLAFALLWQNDVIRLGSSATPTPSPTSQGLMVTGWQASDITWMELLDSQGSGMRVILDSEGKWVLDAEGGDAADAGVVEEIRSQIAAAQTEISLDPGYDLEAIGLGAAPSHTLTIRSPQGRQAVIHIGQPTPTDSGYYVQVDNAAPAVVSKLAIDAILEKLQREQLVRLETFPTAQP